MDEGTHSRTPTGELLREAVGAAGELASTEVELAKDDLKQTARKSAKAAIVLGAAVVTAVSGLQLMLLSAVLAGGKKRSRSVLMGLGMVTLGAAGGAVGVAMLPTNPLGKIKERIQSDIDQIKEQIT
ncbi:phage holin family protein [Chondromyces apiculatus]|uniref:Phage holin family protein n=1 Tax=Chondromyces apiculatus DSM 436 TaxID=1192034 RepID=A0A017SU07_9BACT|nr:phage holin family protein [Chondromyces apiculatus]EYF00050.1 Hypothetical protein CAP_1598 [Chondromyces apiculatus DSM 436]